MVPPICGPEADVAIRQSSDASPGGREQQTHQGVPVTATKKQHRMTPNMTRLIGAINIAAGVVGMAALVATYGLAEQLVARQEAAPAGTLATQAVHVFGGDFTVTVSMSVLLLGAASGLVGSAIQQSIIFAHRAGHETLEGGFVWWYLLRPIWSALLGAVLVTAVNAGLISIGDQTTSTAGVTVLVTVGCFAGLFTDQALDKLRDVLGATDPAKPVVGTSKREGDDADPEAGAAEPVPA